MKYIVDIKGEIEGDYEIIGKYEERPHGEWINICTLPIIRKCSLCGVEQSSEVGFYDNYCPCCGAYMKGGAK